MLIPRHFHHHRVLLMVNVPKPIFKDVGGEGKVEVQRQNGLKENTTKTRNKIVLRINEVHHHFRKLGVPEMTGMQAEG
ncbi:hypothetical protein TNCV_4197371 [Trichonephila clavipes]|nr:hypothetical protein TNCV_4197371 [Trichonephila clavipes]